MKDKIFNKKSSLSLPKAFSKFLTLMTLLLFIITFGNLVLWNKYINIDEVQDTSTLEYFIIEKIFKGNNILLCGDMFQTIYGWRGSEPNKILEFYKKEYNPIEIVFSKITDQLSL